MIKTPPPISKISLPVWSEDTVILQVHHLTEPRESWVLKKKQKYSIFLIHWELLLESDIFTFSLQSNNHFYTYPQKNMSDFLNSAWNACDKSERKTIFSFVMNKIFLERETGRETETESESMCMFEDLCVLGGLLFSVISSLFLLQLDDSSIFCPSMIVCDPK